MARRNNSRKLPNRPRYLPLVGDPSPLPSVQDTTNADDLARSILVKQRQDGVTIEEQLANMNDQELFNLGLNLGIKATDMLGVDKCIEHSNMKEYIGAVSSVRYSLDVVWCRGCFGLYRYP